MKNLELHVARLSRFKTGPSISVWYVSFLHATSDLLTYRPAYSVHHRAQLFRAFFPVSVCKLQNKETYAHACNFQLCSDFSKRNWKKPLIVCRECIAVYSGAGFVLIPACMRQWDVSNWLLCINFAILLWENTVLSGKIYKHTHALKYFKSCVYVWNRFKLKRFEAVCVAFTRTQLNRFVCKQGTVCKSIYATWLRKRGR